MLIRNALEFIICVGAYNVLPIRNEFQTDDFVFPVHDVTTEF